MSRTRNSPTLRPPVLLSAALVVALAAALPAPRPAHSGTALTWNPLGFAGYEFTTIVSPPGNPCIVAWTGLNNGGLGVSTDCGTQYARLFLPSAHDVTAQNENIGYVAAGTLGMVKTLDTGTNWFPINLGLTGTLDARAVILHVAKPESVFCATYGGGVFLGGPKSVGNDTIRWAAMNDGLADLRVRALARVRGGTFLVAATEGGIARWANGAWTTTAPGVIANALVIDPGDSSRVYAATEAGFYRSTNQGMSWSSPPSNGLPVVALNDVVKRTDALPVLYAGTRGQGVWESINGGSSWRKFGPDLPGDNDVRAVLCTVGADAADSAMVFAGTRANGLYRAEYSTPAERTSWGRVKSDYRR